MSYEDRERDLGYNAKLRDSLMPPKERFTSQFV